MEFILLLAAGLTGLFAHWLKKWSRGQTKSGFIDYMRVHKKHSVGSVLAVVTAVITMYASSDVVLNNQILATMFLAGYSIDSAVNKSKEES